MANSIGHDNISKYQEIGGWLLLFVLWAVISIIRNLVTAIREIGAISTLREFAANVDTISIPNAALSLLTINVIMGFVIIALTVIFVAQVSGRKSRFLFFYQLAVILGLCTGILGFIALNMIEGAPGSGGVVWNLFLGAGGLLLFTLYCSSSVRVRVYMDNDEYFTKAIFTLKDKDEAFITENTRGTAPILQKDVSTASRAGSSAQNANLAKPSADTIFCKGCEKSYSCVRDTCPYCKMPNTVSTCEGCKGRYAATHDSCPHCNNRENL